MTWTVTQPKHTDLKATAAPYREALFFNGDIQIPELIFKIGEGRVNIVEICSGLSTHDELSEAWWGGQVQIKSIK